MVFFSPTIKLILLSFLFYFIFAINEHKEYKKHDIEIYQLENSFSMTSILDFNILLEAGIKKIVSIYTQIFKIEKELLYKSKYLQKLYQKIIVLKNTNIPINKKIEKLFSLIINNIPNKNDQEFILKIYKKILYIFL